MRIRSDDLREVLMNYIEDMFAQLSQGWENMVNKVVIKMLINNKFNVLAPLFDNESKMNVEDLENFLMPEVRKLGVIEIKGLNKQFNLREDDFIRLFAQIKSRSTND